MGEVMVFSLLEAMMLQLTSRLLLVCIHHTLIIKEFSLTRFNLIDDVCDLFKRITGTDLAVENLKVQQPAELD